MDIADQLEEALIEREDSDFGGTLSYGGADYPCSIGPMRNQAQLDKGGFAIQKTQVVVVRKSILVGAAAFHSGQFVTVKDKLENSNSLKIAPEGVNDGVWFWELTLNDRAQTSPK